MIFFTSPRTAHYIVISAVAVLASGCQTVKSPGGFGAIQAAHGRNSSKVIYPTTDRRPYMLTENTQLGKLRWLVDSGASHSVIFDNGSRSLEGILTDKAGAANHVHGIFSTSRKKLKGFAYQADRLPPLSGYVLTPNSQQHKLADGILGISSLRRHGAVLLPRQKLLLWNAAKSDFTGTTSINLRRHSLSGHLIATVYHNGQALHLILDTGAARSIISPVSAQKLKSSQHTRSIRLSGVHTSRSSHASVKKLDIRFAQSLPSSHANFIVTDIANLRQQLNNPRDLHIDGILGYDVISRFCQAIDFGQGILYIPNKH